MGMAGGKTTVRQERPFLYETKGQKKDRTLALRLTREAVCSVKLFCTGGVLYNLIEIAWRGYTHWSMFFVGGACFHIMGRIQKSPYIKRTLSRCALCSAAVTAVEYVSGCLVNLVLKLNVWDYSALPLNLHGQVCALYAVLWGGLSLIARPVYRLLKKAMMEQGPAHGQRISLHC